MEHLLSLIIFSFVAAISPGPNNLMLMASGLNHGVRKSLPHYFGICFGFPLLVACVGFGMGTFFARYPNVYLYIKVIGITYLLYLAWKIANSGNANASAKIRAPFSFIQAAAFQWLNPKAWTMALSALAAFTSKDNFVLSVITIITVYFVLAFICAAFWLKLGNSLKTYLSVGKRVHYFNGIMAALLVLSLVPMATSSLS